MSAACSSSDKDTSISDKTLLYSDFEQLDGWCPPNPSLTTDFAHSGRFSIKTAPDIEYSLAYIKTLGLISPKRIKRVKLSAWAYLPEASSGSARLTLAFDDPAQGNKLLLSEAIDLGEAAPEQNKWQEVSKEITLPDNIEFTHEMRIFIWKSSATTPTYIDDVRVDVLE